MLRPATPDLMERLRLAADGTDRDLDTALTCLGVLPPADLESIRTWLHIDGVALHATENADGHRIIEMHVEGRLAARINHDGAIRIDGAPPQRQGMMLSA